MLEKLGVAILIALLYVSSVMADSGDVTEVLNNVDGTINEAVTKAARLFEKNHGKPMADELNILEEVNNPYLKILRITKDYRVELKFADKTKKVKDSAPAMAKDLADVDIILVPVFKTGDTKVTLWKCITNADRNIQGLTADATQEYSASYVRKMSSNAHLSLCMYVNEDLVAGGANDSK